MERKTFIAIAAALVVGLAAVYLVWRPGAREPAPRSPAAGPLVAQAAGSAVIEGEAQLTGDAPPPGKLHREADPYCARREMSDPTVLVANGKLANVWVHVIEGAPDSPAPATPVEIHQQDCMYAPRVATAVVGQQILTHNEDPVLHNVHAYLGTSSVLNKGMPNEKAAPIAFVTPDPGVLRLKCDVHPWMRGYVGVSRNAFQAVTGADGAFLIPNLPPGRYTIEDWHEKLGATTVEVTAPARVIFTYDGAGNAAAKVTVRGGPEASSSAAPSQP